MKAKTIALFLLLLCGVSFGAFTRSVDTRSTWNNNMRWTGDPKDYLLDWAQEVEDYLDGSTGLKAYLAFDQIAAPSGNPATDEGWLYVKDNGGTMTLYFEDDQGTATSCIAGAGSPAGADTHIQYNNGGSFGGIAKFIYDDTNVELANDFALAFGTSADFTINFDDSVDDQLLIATNNTSATATTDPMVQYLFDADTANGTGMTADQQVWGIAKGTQASNVDLLVLDEDGDLTVAGDLSVGGDFSVTGSWSVTDFTATGDVAIGDDTGTFAVSSTGIDITSAGAISNATDLTLSGDITMSTAKGVKSSTTSGHTVGVYGYDNDAAGYVGALVVTNGNTPATVLGNNNGTTAIASSDWAITTTGVVSGFGNVGIDGAVSISNASPTINLNDTDASAGDDNVILSAAATDTGDGTEDVDMTIAQQINGTSRTVATFDADGNITFGYGTQNIVSTADIVVTGSDLSLGTAGVKLTGDGDGAITFLGLGDGADENLTWNFDDTANEVTVSSSTSVGVVNFSAIDVRGADLESSNATPSIEFYDTDASAGDISAVILAAATDTGDGTEDIDVTFRHQVNGSNADFLVADADGALTLNGTTGITMSDTVTFSGGQTRKLMFLPKEIELDGTNPPALSDHGTDGQCNISVLQFDADGGVTGDDIAYISWLVPDGYVVDSARLNVGYTFSTAEDAADEAQFDFTVNAVAAGETLDAAGTALADQTTVIADASADNGKLHITQYNIEVEDIAVDDLVTIKIAVDESASALAASGTPHVLYCEIEWESTE